jgi:hypothetical protein
MIFIITALSILVAAAIGVLVLAVVLVRSLRSAHPGPALGPAVEAAPARKAITR